jgi:hypothetical protein
MTFFSMDTTDGDRAAPRPTRFFSLGLPTWASGPDVDRGFSVRAMPRSRRIRRLRRRGRREGDR